jgi:hypothetical protein
VLIPFHDRRIAEIELFGGLTPYYRTEDVREERHRGEMPERMRFQSSDPRSQI